MDVWQLTEALTTRDLSTDSYEKRETRPETDISTKPEAVTLHMQDKQSYYLFSEAYLELEFTVTKATGGTGFTEADRLFIPDACALISQAKLEVNQTSVSELDGVGHVHHLNMLTQQSAEYAKSVGSNAFYYPMRARDGVGYSGTALGTRNGTDNVVHTVYGTNDVLLFSDAIMTAAGLPNANAEKRFVPIADHMSPLVREGTLSGTAGVIGYNANLFHNPDYDENFVRGVRALTDSKKARASIPLRDLFPVLAQTMGVATRGSTLKLDLNMLFSQASEAAADNVLAPAVYLRNSRTTADATIPRPAIKYNKISLWIPRIKPSLLSETKLSSMFAQAPSITRFYEDYRYSAGKIPAGADTDQTYRLVTTASRPTKIIVALQKSNRRTDFLRHPLQYDDLGLKQIELRINGITFPSERYDTGRHLPRILDDVYLSANKSYDVDSGSLITAESFLQGQHRVYVFDLSHTSASAFEAKNLSDLEIHWVLNAAIAQEYICHAVVVQQRQLQMSLMDSNVLITQN